jgi:hypothetical protein
VRFEPFIVPKQSLTGDSTERVDTRVLQVIYRVEPDRAPLFIGQQLDIISTGSQFWSIVPGVRIPVLTGGRLREQIDVQEARQEQTLQQYEKAILVAVEEVENALVGRDREERTVGSWTLTPQKPGGLCLMEVIDDAEWS